MRITSQLTRALVGLLVCLTCAACGGGHHSDRQAKAPAGDQSAPTFPTPPPASTSSQGNDQPGAPGAPGGGDGGNGGNGGNGPAPGAPIKIPAIILDQGDPIDQIHDLFMNGGIDPGTHQPVDGILQQCGGTACVTVETKAESKQGFTRCTFVEVVPPPESVQPRSLSTVIVLYTGTDPCESPSPGDNGGQSPSPGDNGGQSPSPGDNGGQSPSPGDNGGQ